MRSFSSTVNVILNAICRDSVVGHTALSEASFSVSIWSTERGSSQMLYFIRSGKMNSYKMDKHLILCFCPSWVRELSREHTGPPGDDQLRSVPCLMIRSLPPRPSPLLPAPSQGCSSNQICRMAPQSKSNIVITDESGDTRDGVHYSLV